MKRILFSIAFVIAGFIGLAQPVVTVGTVSGTPGSTVNVPVTISGCNNGYGITGFEFHVSYNSAVQYLGVVNLYSGLSAGDCTFNGTSTQFIGLWTSPTFAPYDIPDGTVLFEIQFIAKNGGTSPLDFINIGDQTILLDVNFDVINATTWTNGAVTVPAPPASTTWNSASAQSWTTLANWSNGLPGATSTAIIGSGTMTIDNAYFLCNNLVVDAGAGVTINSGITVNIPGDITLESNSTNTSTGSLIINGVLNVAGQRIVKRWIEGSKNHFISTPLRLGTTINSLYVPTNSGWAYSWDEPTASWVNMVNLTDPIQVGYGYAVNYNMNQTLTFTISDNPGFNTGSKYNPTTTASNGGWNLVGNPYLATLNWLGSGWKKSGIDNAIYFYDGTNYASFVGGVGSNGGTQYIPAMQGFFVHASGSSDFQMPKTALVHNPQTFYKESMADVRRLSINGAGYSDETVIRFDALSTATFDTEYDAYKLISMNEEVPQVFSTDGNSDYSINSLPEISNTVVNLSTKIGLNGTYTLVADNLNSFSPDVAVYLEDHYSNMVIDLRENASYTFESATGEFDRFTIRLEKSTGIGDGATAVNSVFVSGNRLYINNEATSAAVYTVSGQLVKSVELEPGIMNSIELNNVVTGIYLVRTISDMGIQISKVHVK